MSDSKIVLSPSGTSYLGEDAVRLYQALALRTALKLHLRTGLVPNKGWTIGKMYVLAESFSHKSYRRGQQQKAIDDLTLWIEAMKSALPIENREGEAPTHI
jgi:hypothetical protein